MKKIVFVLLSLVPIYVMAQDVIVKKDGSTILSRILEVSSSEVRYKKYSNLDGPTYTIEKSKIQIINFENGDSEDFGRNSYNSGVNIKSPIYNDWNSIYVKYNSSTIALKEGDDKTFSGLSVGYTHSFSVLKTSPLFFETGAIIQYLFSSRKVNALDVYDLDKRIIGTEHQIKDKIDYLSINIPLNLLYKINIPNSQLSFAPFLGVVGRFNLYANERTKTGEDLQKKLDYLASLLGATSEFNSTGHDDNLLKKNNHFYEDKWGVFQIGWHIGTNVYFNKHIMAGVSYGTDLMEITKDTKLKNLSVSLAYIF